MLMTALATTMTCRSPPLPEKRATPTEQCSKLSSATLDALKDFYREKDEREKHFEALKSSAESDFEKNKFSMEAFAEDWNASQFWV